MLTQTYLISIISQTLSINFQTSEFIRIIWTRWKYTQRNEAKAIKFKTTDEVHSWLWHEQHCLKTPVYSDICQDICLHHISAIFAPWESQNRERKGHPSATNSCHIFCFVCNLLSWALNMIFLFKDFLPRYIFSLCNFSVLLRCKYRASGLIPERYLFIYFYQSQHIYT